MAILEMPKDNESCWNEHCAFKRTSLGISMQNVFGAEHHNVAITLAELAHTYGQLGDREHASELLVKAQIIEQLYAEPQPHVLRRTASKLKRAFAVCRRRCRACPRAQVEV